MIQYDAEYPGGTLSKIDGNSTQLRSTPNANFNGEFCAVVQLTDGSTTLFAPLVSDGSLSTSDQVSVTVLSPAQQAATLRAKVTALQTAGVLNTAQTQVLNNFLDLNGSNSDKQRVQRFLNTVVQYHRVGVLSETKSDELRELGYNLLVSVRIR